MIIIGADHAGFELKEEIKKYFEKNEIKYLDVTNYSIDYTDDYVDVAEDLCSKVKSNNDSFGIAICGTGVGISIACNKIKGIRAGLCYSIEVAQLLKKHNNCNVICFGGRNKNNTNDIIQMIEEFMNSKFEGERHERRINKISMLEEKFSEDKI